MLNEFNTTEHMILSALQNIGWQYIPPENLPRSSSDVIVEPLLKQALINLNPEIAKAPSRADEIIHKLRTFIASVRPADLITHNERFKKLLFEENSYPFADNGRMIPVRFFGTLSHENLALNNYVVTHQWTFPRKTVGKRLDIVLLINGIPVAIGEMKSPVRHAVSWLDAALDISDYEQSIPQMFVPNVLNFATDGRTFRYAPVKMPAPKWLTWRTGSSTEGTLADVRNTVRDFLTPAKVMDIMQFFTLFSTDSNYRKYKIICRKQQYDAADLIVKRVISGKPKQGLIWHFQGSGKSLLIAFTAQKLRMIPELKNPTVVIVDDRLDLETQINSDLTAAEIPNTESISTKEDLINFFRNDTRKIAVTTIFRFGDVEEALNLRSNIIVMADEAHRTQEGTLGERMRIALPNAFFFGLTGTPINRTDKNTFRTFGAPEDTSGYLSRYSFSDSIRDGATLPLMFETVPAALHVDREKINLEFDAMTENLTEQERAELSRRVNMKAIFYSRKRIRKVCEHIVKHFTEKVLPSGCKGMIVVYDRECCMMYKEELDRLISPEASTVVIDTNNDKAGRFKKFCREREEEAKVLDAFRDKDGPLKLLVVTSKLLTGFDAPVLQVMYLDKPMRDHNLLQAVCRTNRVYDSGKTHGLIVDYIGVFDRVADVLNFDEKEILHVISGIEEVKKQIPALLKKCMSYFVNADMNLSGWERLIRAQECLTTDDARDAFGADYRVLCRAWEDVAPDPELVPLREDYRRLTEIYESVRDSCGNGALVWAELGAKTLALVHRNLQVGEMLSDDEILTLDADMIEKYIRRQPDVRKTAKKLEADLIARIRKHSNNPAFQELGEKVERLKKQHEQGLIASIDFLKSLLELAKETAQAERLLLPDNFDRGRAALTELFYSVKNLKTPAIIERLVNDIDGVVKAVRFENWKNTTAGRRDIQRVLRDVLYKKYRIADGEVFSKAYSYIEQYY